MDDTVEIREVHERNNGRDPFPLLMNRQRVPKVLVKNASMFGSVYPLLIGTFFWISKELLNQCHHSLGRTWEVLAVFSEVLKKGLSYNFLLYLFLGPGLPPKWSGGVMHF